MKTRMHKNSLKAYASLTLGPIERSVLSVYAGSGKTTDRSIQWWYSFLRVQPRITSLLAKKLLKECDDIKCPVSGRTVRTCKITHKGRKALKG
jgi:hypothetical protein